MSVWSGSELQLQVEWKCSLVVSSLRGDLHLEERPGPHRLHYCAGGVLAQFSHNRICFVPFCMWIIMKPFHMKSTLTDSTQIEMENMKCTRRGIQGTV